MRAAVYRGPGNITVEDVPDPKPGPGEILLDVTMAAICGTDAAEWAHGPILARPPVILGHEFVGTIAAFGEGARREGLSIGSRVVSGAGISCGTCQWCRRGQTNLCAEYATLGLHRDGGLAERIVTPVDICVPVPDGVDDASAAMSQPLAVGIHAARRGRISKDGTCAVIGIGGIGAFVVAAAAAAGAASVIAVDIDDRRLARAEQLGATTTVNSRNSDPVAVVKDITGGDGVDSVVEASGVASNPALSLNMVRRGGDIVVVGLHPREVPIDLLSLTTREIDLHGTLAHVCSTDLPDAVAALSAGPIGQAVLGEVIDLDDLVDKGIRPLSDGRAGGKIVVTIR